MRIVMTLLVRNEEDVIAHHLDHHLAQGIDEIIVTDNGSVDRTVPILEQYARRGRVRIVHEPADDFAQDRWVTRMARMAAADLHADWVINSDADEFWVAVTAKNVRKALDDVPWWNRAVVANRYNHVPRPDSGLDPLAAMRYRHRESINFDGKPLSPKVAHRADPEVVVHPGNHSITSRRRGSVRSSPTLEILHLPMRSYSKFEQKIALGGAALERNQELPQSAGHQWRRWYGLWKAGELRPEWDSLVFSEEAIAESLLSGALIADSRLEYLITDDGISEGK